jgi:histidinol-phosphate aminotransferase
MSKYWSELVRQLEPYVPGEQPQVDGLIKLNTNENPYPPSPKVTEALKASALDRLRLYPDPYSRRLQASVADFYGVKPEQVFVGNGSDEVLAFAFLAFFKQKRPLLYPDITYSFYPVYCQLFGITAKQIPVREDFSLALEDYPTDNGGIIFPNPNAPTSMALPLTDIEALLQRNTTSVVVVDEAYVDFGSESAVTLVDSYPNLLVIQTLSKSRSLAGLRVGFAMGHVDLIEGLDRVKNSVNSYPVDQLAQTVACAAVDDREYFAQCRDQVIATRDWCTQALEDLGFDVLPSQTNFLFARPPAHARADDLAQALRDEKILVRHFRQPRIADYLRISLGTDAQMRRLADTLKQLLAPQTSG